MSHPTILFCHFIWTCHCQIGLANGLFFQLAEGDVSWCHSGGIIYNLLNPEFMILGNHLLVGSLTYLTRIGWSPSFINLFCVSAIIGCLHFLFEHTCYNFLMGLFISFFFIPEWSSFVSACFGYFYYFHAFQISFPSFFLTSVEFVWFILFSSKYWIPFCVVLWHINNIIVAV